MIKRETDRDRDRDRERERERQTETETETEREIDREREWEREKTSLGQDRSPRSPKRSSNQSHEEQRDHMTTEPGRGRHMTHRPRGLDWTNT